MNHELATKIGILYRVKQNLDYLCNPEIKPSGLFYHV